ncbi:uncharacterized protein [Battus philenor]|uniref:uncharacterized protein n=1 Tax=Battus philenor TaxID=42288 RepID=UPI0035D0B453
MGSEMCKRNLKNIVQYLKTFESAPKEIKGRLITEWFRNGERVFEELCDLGISAGWRAAAIEREPELQEIITRVTRNQNWLQSFLSCYPSLRLDLDGGCSAVGVCRVRSGLEFLLRGFARINTSFDKVLKDLEELGEVEELDSQLKVWVERGHRPNFFPGDKHPSIPSSHWWWF